jgi:hypothetical protein
MGVACLALAVALSGTAYAVTRLPANSVGTKQIINHSLQRVDFKRGMLLRGPQGPRGAQGPVLALSSISLRSKGAEISRTAGVDTNVSIICPEGSIAWTGGYRANVPVYTMTDWGSGGEWTVVVRSTGASPGEGLPGSLYVYTQCVKTS